MRFKDKVTVITAVFGDVRELERAVTMRDEVVSVPLSWKGLSCWSPP